MSGIHFKGQQLQCAAILIMTIAATISGCSKGPAMTTVVGTVTIDGKPLEKGSIAFEPADGQGPTTGATIEGGRYAAKALPGQKMVRITGFEIVGKRPAYPGRPDSPMRDIVKDVVPEKYNSNSDLTLTVESSDTTGDFNLKSS
jgi:hypothetical protein